MNKSDFDMNGRDVPPGGRLIEYSEPHSPFQKLIDAARRRHRLSGRDLAERIGVSQSTVWIWLHNVNGYPHPKSFKPEHLSKISEVLKIPEAKLKSALDASRHLFTPRKTPKPHRAFDPFRNFIWILKNDRRKTFSKAYVLNLAKNLYRGAKVTLWVIFAVVTLQTASSLGDDPQTLVTVSGKRYEKVRVTEVTPVTIAFMHSTGAARLPLTDFGPDVQRKYGYDEAKARAWIAAQTKREQEQRVVAAAAEKQKRAEARVVRAQVDAIADYLDAGGQLEYDPITKQLYDPDVAAARRREAMKFYRRYGYWPVNP